MQAEDLSAELISRVRAAAGDGSRQQVRSLAWPLAATERDALAGHGGIGADEGAAEGGTGAYTGVSSVLHFDMPLE